MQETTFFSSFTEWLDFYLWNCCLIKPTAVYLKTREYRIVPSLQRSATADWKTTEILQSFSGEALSTPPTACIVYQCTTYFSKFLPQFPSLFLLFPSQLLLLLLLLPLLTTTKIHLSQGNFLSQLRDRQKDFPLHKRAAGKLFNATRTWNSLPLRSTYQPQFGPGWDYFFLRPFHRLAPLPLKAETTLALQSARTQLSQRMQNSTWLSLEMMTAVIVTWSDTQRLQNAM